MKTIILITVAVVIVAAGLVAFGCWILNYNPKKYYNEDDEDEKSIFW